MKHPLGTPVVIGIAIAASGYAMPPGSTLQIISAVVGVGLALAYPLFWCYRGLFRSVNENLKVVKQGIPTPQEIRQQFIQLHGVEPTAQEVAAIHQMATSRHNQALLGTAVGVGGATIAAHTATGKWL